MSDALVSAEQRVQRMLAEIGTSAIASYGSLSKAAACSDGFASRLSWALIQRNSDPDAAREHLIGAFTAYEIVKRVMLELEADAPEYAGQGAARAAHILEMLDRRDGVGAYA